MCLTIYIFCFNKTLTQTKIFPLANLFVQIYIFYLQKIKDRDFCFSTKKSAVRVVLSLNFILKIQLNWWKPFFAAAREKIFFVTHISGNKSIVFWPKRKGKPNQKFLKCDHYNGHDHSCSRSFLCYSFKLSKHASVCRKTSFLSKRRKNVLLLDYDFFQFLDIPKIFQFYKILILKFLQKSGYN